MFCWYQIQVRDRVIELSRPREAWVRADTPGFQSWLTLTTERLQSTSNQSLKWLGLIPKAVWACGLHKRIFGLAEIVLLEEQILRRVRRTLTHNFEPILNIITIEKNLPWRYRAEDFRWPVVVRTLSVFQQDMHRTCSPKSSCMCWQREERYLHEIRNLPLKRRCALLKKLS